MPITQINNSESKSLTSSRSRRLNNPVHAWGDINSFVMSLPGLVGYWPGAVDIGTPLLLDVSGNGLHLTRTGDAEVALDPTTPLVGYLQFDDGVFSHADDARLDILGTETIIDSALRGLTAMCWIYISDLASLDAAAISKWDAASQDSFRLGIDGGTRWAFFSVESPAGAGAGAATDADTFQDGIWYFLAGRYTPSVSVKVWLDLLTAEDTTSIPASLRNSTDIFRVGHETDALTGQDFNGRLAHPLICAAALPDVVIETFYQMTAPLFAKQV